MDQLAAWFDSVQAQTYETASATTHLTNPEERRFTGEQLVAFFSDRKLVAVATMRPDGQPHVVVNQFVMSEDGGFWLPLLPGAVRRRNVENHPRVALLFIDGEGPTHSMVRIEGPAEIMDRAPRDVLLQFPLKLSTHTDWMECWLHVVPEKLFSYGAVKSRYNPVPAEELGDDDE
jgi:hypothetical protein